jgi:tetratricopeptide (TPR) repeat protein
MSRRIHHFPTAWTWRTAALALLLAAPLAHAQSPATANAPLTVKDTRGQDLVIPAKDKPTLLLFLRPGQGQSEEAARIVAPLANGRPVQIITVVSGEDAAPGAARLAAKAGAWPAVADTDYAASGRFAVKVWPTAVVVKPGGEICAHLAGLPVTFANDLAAYLDFAAGKLDKAGLDKALSDREVVADSTAQKAARHVEVALRLAEKGMNDQAGAELAKAVELKPSEGAVLLSMTRVNLMLGDPKTALSLLAQLKEGQFPAGEINTLKGWAAVESGEWADAKKLLTTATMLNPDPAQAYYLLARVYEHDNDLPAAAGFYRKAFERSPTGKQMGALPAAK